MHRVDSTEQILAIQVTTGQGQNIWATVVGEEQEHVILLGRLEDLLASALVTRQHLDQVLRAHLLLLVVDNNTLVHIGHVVTGVVVQLARERVGRREGHIVVHHGDDVVGINASSLDDLVGMGNIGVVAVVAVTLRAADQHHPVGSRGDSQQKKCKRKSLHCLQK